MKNLLALVGLVVVGFAAAGWYLGWYKIGKQTDATGKTQLNIQVDANKVKNDLDKAKEKASNLIEQQGSQMPPMPTMPPVPQVQTPPWGSNVPVPPAVSDLNFPAWPTQPPSMPNVPPAPPKQQSSGWLIPW